LFDDKLSTFPIKRKNKLNSSFIATQCFLEEIIEIRKIGQKCSALVERIEIKRSALSVNIILMPLTFYMSITIDNLPYLLIFITSCTA
jgi:hypothetical protein